MRERALGSVTNEQILDAMKGRSMTHAADRLGCSPRTLANELEYRDLPHSTMRGGRPRKFPKYYQVPHVDEMGRQGTMTITHEAVRMADTEENRRALERVEDEREAIGKDEAWIAERMGITEPELAFIRHQIRYGIRFRKTRSKRI